MFFGMPSKIPGMNGNDIRGVIGFLGAVGKLIDMTRPTHIAVLFDSQTHNPRCDINVDYKANRIDYSEVPEEENPFSQLEGIYLGLDFLDIAHTEIQGAEVDDAIASYALAGIPDTEIYISSYDSDYFQLISENVKVIRYRGDCSILCDEEYLYSKLGIAPSVYADHKSLVGDTSDNIKGIPGVGPKTATKLINAYGSLCGIYSCIDTIENKKIKDKLIEFKAVAEQNYSLIKLGKTADLPFSLDEMIYSGKRYKTMQILKEIGL